MIFCVKKKKNNKNHTQKKQTNQTTTNTQNTTTKHTHTHTTQSPDIAYIYYISVKFSTTLVLLNLVQLLSWTKIQRR